jgi:hypothetical protein
VVAIAGLTRWPMNATVMSKADRRSGLAYWRVFQERLVGHHLDYLRRALRRTLYYVAAIDTDWPTLRNHLIYSVGIMPVSLAAYASWLLLVWRRTRPLLLLTLLGVTAVYSVVVHGLLVYDQRYVLPSVPVLCVLCSLGALDGFGTRQAGAG